MNRVAHRVARVGTVAALAATLAAPVDRLTLHAAAQVTAPATVQVAQAVATATVTPIVNLTFSSDHASAIPGDVVHYAATLTGNGLTLTLSGDITASNTSASAATVASYFDGVDYQMQANESLPGEANDLVLNSGSWISLAARGAVQSGYVPALPPPSGAGDMSLTLTPAQSAGVSYPSSGDTVLGTVIQPGSTATWHCTASVPVNDVATVRKIMEPTQVDALRVRAHVEVTPSTQQLAQQSSAQTVFTEKLFGESPDGGVDDALDGLPPEPETAATDTDDGPVQSTQLQNVSMTFTPPSGAVQTNPNLPWVMPGESATWNPSYRVPVANPKGGGETDAAYLARLQALEAAPLTASVVADGTVPAGPVHAAAPAVSTTEHLPILHIAKSGPTTVLASTGATFPLVISNSGGVDASSVSTADHVANGDSGSIADAPASLAAGATTTAHAVYTVPLLQPIGSLSDTAPLTWRDANINVYGPISSTYTTTITSPLSGARLTLTPPVNGPNVTGTQQVLQATLLTSGGSPIQNAPVSLAVTGPNATSLSATTDAGGIAGFHYSGARDGVDTATATLSAAWTTITSNAATVQWFQGTGAALSITPIDAGILPTGTAQAFTATLVSGAGNPVANAAVAFTVTGPNPTSGTVTTNAQGVAVFSYAGAADGTDAVQASVTVGSFQVRSVQAHVQWFQLPGATLVLLPAAAGPNPTGTSQSFTATLTSGLGHPVANATISFSVTGANPGGGTAVTDAQGVARFAYTGANPVSDMVQASYQPAAGASTLQSSPSPVTWVQLAGAALSLSQPPMTGTGNPVTLSAVLTTGGTNQPVPNARVSFAVTGPNATTGSGVTDATGTATFTYTGTHDGIDTVQASTLIGTSTVLSPLSHVQWYTTAGTTLFLTPSSAGPDPTGTSQALTATLVSGTGAPIAGATVAFTVTGANPTSGTRVTDASGVAVYSYSGAQPGNDTVQASFQGAQGTPLVQSGTSAVSWIQLSGATLVVSQPSLMTLGTPVTLSATLTSGGNSQPVANASISFTVTGANPGGGTGVTNSAGMATFSYTGTVEGLDTVVAQYTTSAGNVVSTPVNVRWFQISGATITVAPATSGPDATGTTQAMQATFLSGRGNPVPDAPLTVTVVGSNPQVLSATTDAGGVATFSVSGTQGGQDSVHATYGSGSSSVVSNTATVSWIQLAGATLTLVGAPTQTTGATVQMQATLRDGGNGKPVPGATIAFAITGPNATSGSGTTNTFGVATFSYTGSAVGLDTIVATFTLGGTTLQSNQVTQRWYQAAGAQLTLSPATAGPLSVGNTQGLQATLVDGSGAPIPGVQVTATITGPNAQTQTATTDGSGVVTFTYRGVAGGSDAIVASVASTSPPITSNTAHVSWIKLAGATITLDDAGPGVVGGALPLTATLRSGDNGNPVAYALISFAVSGVNATGGSSTSDQAGVAHFSYTGAHAGMDSIQATTTVDGTLVTSNTLSVGWIVPLQPVSTTTVTGRFFFGNSGGFNTPPNTTPVFTTDFPTIDFNPAGGLVPFNRSGVNVNSRPFTDITTDVNGSYSGALVAQGNGYQAGVGPMGSFQAVFTANLEVAQAGDITLFINADDGWVLGVGNGATRVGGSTVNPPASGLTAFMGHPVMGDANTAESPTSRSVTVHFPGPGIYPYELDYTECCGGELTLTLGTSASGHGMAATGTLAITPNAPAAAQVGTRATFTVAALDGAGNPLPNVPVTLNVSLANAQEVSGTTDSAGLAVLVYTGMNAGDDHLQAAARIDGMPAVSNTVTMSWSQVPVPGGGGGGTTTAPAPAVAPPSPADGTIVTKPVPITAGVTPPAGQTITSWAVTYQALDPEPPVTIASGTGAPPAPPTPLATFDPTLLANDAYAVTVSATASGGGTQSATTTLAVAGKLKLGRFTTTYQDMNVPVNGFQMQVRRSYDSYDKRTGDFGVGWKVSLGNFRTSANRQLGAGGWTEYPTRCIIGLCWWAFRTSAPHFVTVTWPDQHQEVFDFTPDGGAALFYFQGTARFTARAGSATTSTLQVAGDPSVSYGFDGNIYGAGGGIFNPTQFNLTTPDGRVLLLDVATGLVSETDASGNSLTIDSSGVHARNGQSITFTRDSAGRISDVTGPTAQHLHYSFTAAGDLATVTDALGGVTTYGYDGAHRLTSATGPGTNPPVSTVTYDASGRVSSVRDASGNTVQLTDNVGTQQQTVLDPSGQLTTVDSFDDLGDLVREDRTFNGHTVTTSATYDGVGRLLTATDALGHVTSASYDALGDVTQATDALGHSWSATYDAKGHVLTRAGPDSVTDLTDTYDSLGRLTRMQRADGSAYQYAYDSAGHLTSVTDPAGHTTQHAYDGLGHLTTTTDAAGAVSHGQYDAAGNLLSVTAPGGAVTSMSYDAAGRIVSLSDPGSHVHGWGYDARGNMTSATDALGRTTTLQYDAGDRLASVTDREGRTVAYAYDVNGRLATRTLPGQDVTAFTYDPLGRLLTAVNSTEQLAYTYDDAGRATTVASSAGASSQLPAVTLSKAYDAAGKLTSSAAPDGTIAYGYDVRNRLSSITDPQGGAFGFGYDNLSRPVSMSRPNGVSDSLGYDSINDLASLRVMQGTTPVLSLSYTYDGGGRRLTRADASATLTYGHDALGQLLSVTPSSGSASEQYTYDALGNRLTSAGSPVSAAYDAQNRITSNGGTSYTFDKDGDLLTAGDQVNGTTSYDWNADHHLTAVHHPGGTVTTYRYDPLGRLVEENDRGAITRWVWDGNNQRLQYDGSNALVASYVDGFGPTAALEMRRTGQSSYYVQDGAHNVVALTDQSGATSATYTYDSFGRLLSSTGTIDNPFRFASALNDPGSGLYQMRDRFYDPGLGRFLSEDPVWHANPYAYVNNAPTDYVDPTGRDAMGEYSMELSVDSVAQSESAAAVGEAETAELGQVESALGRLTPEPPPPAEPPVGGNVSVYQSVNRATGEVDYVGITNDFERRAAEQFASKGIRIDPIRGLDGLTREEARGVEQSLIERYGLGKNGGTLLNKINSIAQSNPSYGSLVQRGLEILAEVGI